MAAFALLWKLGAGTLAAWDEAIYAQVSKEIVQSGNWLTLNWQFAPWFEKPPLFMWITALFYHVFGVNEFAARFPSALSGLLLLELTYKIGKVACNKRVGLLGAVILFTCYHFLSFSRFGTMEVMLTLFIYVAVYAYLKARADRRCWYLAWVACALGIMVKGGGGVVGPAAIVLALVLDRRLSEFRSRQFWQAGLLALMIILPWHLLMVGWYGRQFINEYIGYHVIARITSALEGHSSNYLYYVGQLIDGFFPFVVVAPFAIVSAIRPHNKDRTRSWILLLLPGFVFLLYTAIPTRRPWYIVPLYPALAILIAGFITRFRQRFAGRPVFRRATTVVAVLFLIVAGLYSLLSFSLNHKPKEPIAKLAGIAQSSSSDDREPLILLVDGQHYYFAQVPLFYSNRPILQTYDSAPPLSEDARRYANFIRLQDVVQSSDRNIIFRADDWQVLSHGYEVETISETDGLVYGKIKRK
jgi:4-amino-4-deoxy-L-arabinose transferase-like glycosyltransferase